MAVTKWNPGGYLDIASDPTDLPEEAAGQGVESGAMTRCTNLSLDRAGMARTRWGRKVLSTTALTVPITKLLYQGEDRYAFSAKTVYRNEVSLGATYETGAWDAFLYAAFNSNDYSVFATNGSDRLRVDTSTIRLWGIEAPEDAYEDMQADGYTHEWEDDYATAGCRVTTEHNGYSHIHNWEFATVEGKDWIPPNDSWEYKTTFWFEAYASHAEEREITYGDFEGHAVRYTYCRYDDDGEVLHCESNPSPEFAVEPKQGGVITWPLSTDPQVTHVRVYVTEDMGATYYFHSLHEVADRVARIYKQITALGTALEWDHDRPPEDITALTGPSLDGQCFAIVDNFLHFSKPKQPEYWPLSQYIEIGPPQFPCTAQCFWNAQLYVFTAIEIYLVQGAGASTFYPLPMKALTGALHKDAVVPIQGQGIFHLGSDGIYLFNGAVDNNVTHSRLRPLFEGETVGSIPGLDRNRLAACRLTSYRNRLYLAYPAVGATYANNVLVFDAGGQISHYNYNKSWTAFDLDKTNEQFVGAASDGYLYRLENEQDPDDDGTAIAWEVRSKDFEHQPIYFPRTARWDVTVNTDADCVGQLVLDDEVKQEHAVRGCRNRKRRLISPCNGRRLALGYVGTGGVAIYAAECE